MTEFSVTTSTTAAFVIYTSVMDATAAQSVRGLRQGTPSTAKWLASKDCYFSTEYAVKQFKQRAALYALCVTRCCFIEVAVEHMLLVCTVLMVFCDEFLQRLQAF